MQQEVKAENLQRTASKIKNAFQTKRDKRSSFCNRIPGREIVKSHIIMMNWRGPKRLSRRQKHPERFHFTHMFYVMKLINIAWLVQQTLSLFITFAWNYVWLCIIYIAVWISLKRTQLFEILEYDSNSSIVWNYVKENSTSSFGACYLDVRYTHNSLWKSFLIQFLPA